MEIGHGRCAITKSRKGMWGSESCAPRFFELGGSIQKRETSRAVLENRGGRVLRKI